MKIRPVSNALNRGTASAKRLGGPMRPGITLRRAPVTLEQLRKGGIRKKWYRLSNKNDGIIPYNGKIMVDNILLGMVNNGE